jgi:hypothetical protein
MIWDPQIYKGAMSHDQATRQQAILPKAPTGGEDARLCRGCAVAVPWLCHVPKIHLFFPQDDG